MNNNELQRLHSSFNEYVEDMRSDLRYTSDTFFKSNFDVKVSHTIRVCENAAAIARSEGLDEGMRNLAEAAGLLHDIGRFEQILRYRTFIDSASVDHAALGLEIIADKGFLEGLDEREKTIIQKAINYHNKYEVPEDEEDFICIMFSRLLRDADKLDIMEVLIQFYEDRGAYTEAIESYPDENHYNSELVAALTSGKRINMRDVRTSHDAKLARLAWVFDLNFGWSLEQFRERRFIERITAFLPDNSEIALVREFLSGYIDGMLL